MRLTVLGSAASFAGPGEACAGHLIEGGGARVLFDCGNGVLSNLQRVADPFQIDAVFITHHHADHFADIYAMQAMLRYAPDGPRPPQRLYVPEGLFEAVRSVLSERGAVELDEAFDVRVLQDGDTIVIGDLEVTPRLVDHTDPTFALIARADGTSLCYTADTGPSPRALQAAQGVDLLVAEATLPAEYEGAAPHLTARQAGILAAEADAGQLVLVHIWPSNDRGATASEASAEYDGPVAVANELDTFEVNLREDRT